MIRVIRQVSFRRISSRTSQSVLSCPACKSSSLQIKEDVFCCKSCPNRQGIDYFALLGLPRTYSVNIHTAEQNYRDLQRRAHPDKLESESSNSVPEGLSALLNKAITVIKSPTERCMHLLYLLDGCSVSESNLTNDSGLLLEMMEINEEIEDCKRDKNCLERQAVLNQSRLDKSEDELKSLFAQNEYQQARKICERMHYLERIKDTLLKKLNSIESS
jgi:molecular chaperone HscB